MILLWFTIWSECFQHARYINTVSVCSDPDNCNNIYIFFFLIMILFIAMRGTTGYCVGMHSLDS